MNWSTARALAWKEWRCQRGLLLSGLALAALLPLLWATALLVNGSSARLRELAVLLPVTNWAVLLPLVAAAAPATALTSENTAAQIGFLLSRPVSRRLVLTVKLLVAAGVVGAVALAGQATTAVALALVQVPAEDPARNAFVLRDDVTPVVASLVVVLASLCFLWSTVLSLVTRRALQATLAGTVAATVFLGASLAIWWRVDYLPRVRVPDPALLLLAATLLLFAYLAYARGEMFSHPSHRRRVLVLGVASALAWGLASTGVAAWEMRSPTDSVLFGELSGGGDGVLAVTAARRDGGSRTAAVLAPDRLELADRRLTSNPVLSPDGRYLAYVGGANELGFRANSLSLYVLNRGSGEERLLFRELARPIAESGLPVFSSDGRYVAVQLRLRLVIADVDSARPAREVFVPRCQFAGWDISTGHVLQDCSADATQSLRWIAPETGEEARRVELRGVEGRRWGLRATWPPRRRLAMLLREPLDHDRFLFSALDLPSGREVPLFEQHGLRPGGVDITESIEVGRDGNLRGVVAYASPGVAAEGTRQIWLVYPGTGERQLIDAHDSETVSLMLSPSSQQLIASVRATPGTERVDHFVYDLRSGTRTQLAENWALWRYNSAWVDDTRLAFFEGTHASSAGPSHLAGEPLMGLSPRVRVLDLATGAATLWPLTQ